MEWRRPSAATRSFERHRSAGVFQKNKRISHHVQLALELNYKLFVADLAL